MPINISYERPAAVATGAGAGGMYRSRGAAADRALDVWEQKRRARDRERERMMRAMQAQQQRIFAQQRQEAGFRHDVGMAKLGARIGDWQAEGELSRQKELMGAEQQYEGAAERRGFQLQDLRDRYESFDEWFSNVNRQLGELELDAGQQGAVREFKEEIRRINKAASDPSNFGPGERDQMSRNRWKINQLERARDKFNNTRIFSEAWKPSTAQEQFAKDSFTDEQGRTWTREQRAGTNRWVLQDNPAERAASEAEAQRQAEAEREREALARKRELWQQAIEGATEALTVEGKPPPPAEAIRRRASEMYRSIMQGPPSSGEESGGAMLPPPDDSGMGARDPRRHRVGDANPFSAQPAITPPPLPSTGVPEVDQQTESFRRREAVRQAKRDILDDLRSGTISQDEALENLKQLDELQQQPAPSQGQAGGMPDAMSYVAERAIAGDREAQADLIPYAQKGNIQAQRILEQAGVVW